MQLKTIRRIPETKPIDCEPPKGSVRREIKIPPRAINNIIKPMVDKIIPVRKFE